MALACPTEPELLLAGPRVIFKASNRLGSLLAQRVCVGESLHCSGRNALMVSPCLEYTVFS